MRRVVITGMGCISSLGNDLQSFWEALSLGKSGAGPITKFDASKHKTQFACEVKNFDANAHFDKGESRRYDPYTQYAVVASTEAIKDSGIKENPGFNPHKTGVIWASGNGGISTFDEQMTEYIKGDGTPRFSPFFISRMLVDTASGVIAMKHGLNGINYTAVSACASANSAIMDAFNYIRWGKADIMISGGSEAPITASAIGGFNACKALSQMNHEPQIASRPFDQLRDGFVMGEGAAALILEEFEHAKKRGAKIYAEISGAGMSADAYHLTASHPEGLGAILGMKMALADAAINPDQIDSLNMHATSTPVGDLSEIKSILKLFADHSYQMNLTATKSMTGHLLGAAGAIEAVASILSIQHRLVPPTINTSQLDEEIPPGLNFTLAKAQERKLNYVMSNTFGFGGHNSTVIFKRFE